MKGDVTAFLTYQSIPFTTAVPFWGTIPKVVCWSPKPKCGTTRTKERDIASPFLPSPTCTALSPNIRTACTLIAYQNDVYIAGQMGSMNMLVRYLVCTTLSLNMRHVYILIINQNVPYIPG